MFVVVPRSDRLRVAVEKKIRQAYWKRYSARLLSLAPTIVAQLSASGNIECAAGIRFGHEEFFSECYLSAPIEQILNDRLGGAVSRNHIVEVCHLAGTGGGHSLPFLRQLIALLQAMETDCAIFTATRPLRGLLQRSGLSMLELGLAERGRIANPDCWGDYFEHDPRIMAVDHRSGSTMKDYLPAFMAARCLGDARVF
jgi:hypothetical protein